MISRDAFLASRSTLDLTSDVRNGLVGSLGSAADIGDHSRAYSARTMVEPAKRHDEYCITSSLVTTDVDLASFGSKCVDLLPVGHSTGNQP
jgi:hypothetical protein